MSEFTVEVEREDDGRWIGEVTDLSGVLVYGSTHDEAVAKAKALAFRVLADRIEHGEEIPEILDGKGYRVTGRATTGAEKRRYAGWKKP